MTAASSTSLDGSRSILLHPLCVMAISDQYTRVSSGGGVQPAGSKILGLLFGTQKGLDVSIRDAVEIAYGVSDGGDITLSPSSVEKQEELFTAVYPGYDILGWYSVGEEVSSQDESIHRQMRKYNDNPLFLLMNPKAASSSKALPVVIHESEVHVLNDQPTLLFVSLKFQLTTSTSEQIALEHVARATPAERVSSVDLHTDALCTSLRALLSRIAKVRSYLEEVKEGRKEPDYAVLRDVAGINRFNSSKWGSELNAEFLGENCDSLHLSYLAAIQKSAATLNTLVESYNICSYAGASDRRSRSLY